VVGGNGAGGDDEGGPEEQGVLAGHG